MEEETLARAFEPFFTTKELGIGSGLGLPMVQGFAAQSGGAVQIRSKLGEGTTVEPVCRRQTKRPPKTPATSAPRSPWRQAAILSQGDVLKTVRSEGLQTAI
jgi:hypothetical protein